MSALSLFSFSYIGSTAFSSSTFPGTKDEEEEEKEEKEEEEEKQG